MNKVPGPPSSSPLPAPSPNLPQNFSPTPPPPMVFATPPPMNPTAPPRQPYYTGRPSLPTNAARVQSTSAPRPIPPPHGTHPSHVFQTSSTMMVIPQQPISFPNSQGPAYYIHSQYRPSYVPPQTYQVASSPSFYPGTSPAEYAGAYYPAQPAFTPPVAAAPVIMNPAPQQQAPPPPQHAVAAKRERKQITIRDPNQGGRDITDEIMSGGRSASTPTPPQMASVTSEGGVNTQTNGENTKEAVVGVRTDERINSALSLEFPIPPGESPFPDAPPTPPTTSPISDTVDAPPPSLDKLSFTTQTEDANQQELMSVSSNGSVLLSTKENGAGLVKVVLPLPTVNAESTVDSPIVQPEELQLVNGLTADDNRDVSPLAEPEVNKEALPVSEKSFERTTKTMPPVVQEKSTQDVDETPLSSVKNISVAKPIPVVKEKPSAKETTVPVVKKPPTAVAKENFTAIIKETVATVDEFTSAAAKDIPVPATKSTPVLTTKEMPAPAIKDISQLATTEMPTTAANITPAPASKEVPAASKDSPSASFKEAFAMKDALASTTLVPASKDAASPAKSELAPVVAKDAAAPLAAKDAVVPAKGEPAPATVKVAVPPPKGEQAPNAAKVIVGSPKCEQAPATTKVAAQLPKGERASATAKDSIAAKGEQALVASMDAIAAKGEQALVATKDVTAARGEPACIASTKETLAPTGKELLAPIATAVSSKEALAPITNEAPAPTAAVKGIISTSATKGNLAAMPKENLTTIPKEVPASLVKDSVPSLAVQNSEPSIKKTISMDPVAKETQDPRTKVTPVSSSTVASSEEREDMPPPQPTAPESTMQAVSVPKKKRKLKDLNKKETGDILDAFKEPTPPQPEATPSVKPEPAPEAAPPVEEVEETWEDKEDKLDAENIQPQGSAPPTPTEQKYQYKQEQWKPLNPEEKKKYDRAFLLGFQFISASMNKPEGLPQISDVVLDKVNKTPLKPLDLSRMNCGPDFTPSFANLGRPSGGRGPAPPMAGPRRSAQSGGRKDLRKIVLPGEDVQLKKSENAWKRGADVESDDTEAVKTRDLFRRVRGILNKLTPQMFQQLMKQINDLTIDTEERLKGVIDLVFEKAISEPNFSVAYANMCRCLMGLKVPMTDKPAVSVNFRKLLLNRCQKEFEKDKDDDEIFEKKQKELDAASGEEERQRLKDELKEAKDAARRRSLGNIKFIGELFKLKMLTENIMHDCVVKLLKNHDEESLECLCRLLSTIGKDLDFEKAKPRMEQYFTQMEKIIKERKTSSRIRFMLQDVIDLRRNNWVPRRGDQGPKTIEQIHKDAELEEQREQIKVQQQLRSNKDSRGGGGGGGGGGSGGVTLGPRGVGSASQRGATVADEGWNTVPISTKNRPIDPSRLSKITKQGALDFNNQLLAPGGKGSWGSWGKGSSGGSGTKPSESVQDSGRASTLNRFSALQQPSSNTSVDMDRRVPQRNSSSRERGDRNERLERGSDRNRPAITKRSFSRDKEEWEQRPSEMVRRVSSMSDERLRERERERERERTSNKENVRREPAFTPPPAPAKPALSPEELEKKSTAIIEEYLHINDLKEALQCVSELNSPSLLNIFVRTGIESTLERSAIARQHMGMLLHQLVKARTLSAPQYYKGLMEVLEVAEDMAIDVPHIWVYLAELIVPMLDEGGIPINSLFREVAKPLVPIGKAGDLLAHILNLLCKGMSHKKAGAMWLEAGLTWKEFLPKDENISQFVTERGVEYTLGEEDVRTGSSKKALSLEEISKQLDYLLQDKVDNQSIFDWVEANLDEQQISSNGFVRALMISVCQAAIICENPYKVDAKEISQRAKMLQRYIKDEQKELQALYALQSLMVQMEQPPNLLRMFFDVLYDEDVIKEDGFYKWESSKDPAEQLGKGVALKSVTAFFTWLREPDDESDNS